MRKFVNKDFEDEKNNYDFEDLQQEGLPPLFCIINLQAGKTVLQEI